MMRNSSLSASGSDIPASIEYISEIIYETPATKVHSIPPFPDSAVATGVPVVRTEEALIVIFVLILWVAAIALFFNRWGKIRMLEPYQPKFHQEHRSSCPMVDINHPPISQHRSSFSKFNVNCLEPPPHFAAVPPTYRSLARPRQNSVFVGSSNNMFAVQINPPRKTKSAVDIKSLVLNERPPMSKSMLPMTERRPSTTTLGMRRSSCLLSPRPSCERRPSSCSEFLPGSKDRHTYCNEFLSPMHSFDRRTSTSGDFYSQREQRRPSFNNVIAQVTAERRPSSSMLRISNV
ncbi:uncharacterized protein LOC129002476 [Macrosteles quadrilineatus]|uniref:uncharacterized protein LOC129002476 n=1 Tax=Macrosteles quadrilineatus TaxID=74068 RepID=UPI0023E1AE58|nr:uncharacterized protein LOC129002476 [Macrosteles quadrilineatus]XP_054286286.1 uncharacterized protein LOC129002476 [Macrosteles quadrilineatus]XP_054286287.1 uncharacterized protein LOC129002476 [Macrosteles quadrilineatus]